MTQSLTGSNVSGFATIEGSTSKLPFVYVVPGFINAGEIIAHGHGLGWSVIDGTNIANGASQNFLAANASFAYHLYNFIISVVNPGLYYIDYGGLAIVPMKLLANTVFAFNFKPAGFRLSGGNQAVALRNASGAASICHATMFYNLTTPG